MAKNEKTIEGGVSFNPDGDNTPGLAGTIKVRGEAADLLRQVVTGPKQISLTRPATEPTEDQVLWTAIRNRLAAIDFDPYVAFIERLLCTGEDKGAPTCEGTADCSVTGDKVAKDFGAPSIRARINDLAQRPGIDGLEGYKLLKVATQAFLLFERGVKVTPVRNATNGTYDQPPSGKIEDLEIPGEATRLGRPMTFGQARDELETYLSTQVGAVGGVALPYLKRIVGALLPAGSDEESSPFCEGLLRNRLRCPPFIELIAEYWWEEAGLVQTMNAIKMRFQNRSVPGRDALAGVDFSALQGIGNLIWGAIQDEHNQLSVLRRNHEYLYSYGCWLDGKATAGTSPAETRSRFIPAFHGLLNAAAQFYREESNTTHIADAFRIQQAVTDLHYILTESGGNQYQELPLQARAETLISQFLLSRSPMRQLFPGRPMVAVPQPWMQTVESLKRVLGWDRTSVVHYDTLAICGQRILLSIRYGYWSGREVQEEQARNWVRYFRDDIRKYIYAYRAVTGVDLDAETADARVLEERLLSPSVLLRRRRLAEQGRPALPASNRAPSFVAAELPEADGLALPARRQLLGRTR